MSYGNKYNKYDTEEKSDDQDPTGYGIWRKKYYGGNGYGRSYGSSNGNKNYQYGDEQGKKVF